MHEQVQTRKLIVVGHSQGAMYANRIYDYLWQHAEPKEAMAIYGVATPETILQDKGKYINYEGDNVIYNHSNQIGGVVPPPFNVSIQDWWDDPNAKGDNVGHGFITAYLDNFADRITSEIKSEMFVLRPAYSSEAGGTDCFIPPDDTFGHKAAAVGLVVTDFYADSVVGIAKEGYGQAKVALRAGGTALAAVGNFFGTIASVFSPKSNTSDADSERALNDTGIALLNALNLTSLDMQTADQLQRDTQKKKNNNRMGGAAVLALVPEEPQPQGEVLGSTTEAVDTPTATTTPFPTAPAPMPAENVHYNAPSFGGAAAVAQEEEAPPAPPEEPAPTAAELFAASPPVISYSNWRGEAGVGVGTSACQMVTRIVDIAWSAVPNAAYYELWVTGMVPAYVADFLYATTTATTFPDFSFVNATPSGITPATIWVVARDAAGNSATTSSLISSALADQQGPAVVSFSPAIQATGVAVGSPVVLTYDEPLDPTTVSDQAFFLYQLIVMFPPSRVAVPVTVSLSQDGTAVTITPEQTLEYATGYSLASSCAMSDLVGNHPPFGISIFSNLVDPYFTTVDAPSSPPPPQEM